MIVRGMAQSTVEIVASNLEGKPVLSGHFIDAMDVEVQDVTPFQKVSTTKVQNLAGVFAVNLYHYNGWGADGGFFEVLDIEQDGKRLLRLENSDAWDMMRFNLKRQSENGYYIAVPITPSCTVLFFVGFIRASQPAPVTIIVLNKDGAHLVFNKSYILDKFEKTSNSFSLDLWNDSDPDLTKHFRLWLDNNTIKFQQE